MNQEVGIHRSTRQRTAIHLGQATTVTLLNGEVGGRDCTMRLAETRSDDQLAGCASLSPLAKTWSNILACCMTQVNDWLLHFYRVGVLDWIGLEVTATMVWLL
jgi:hypothetical protein